MDNLLIMLANLIQGQQYTTLIAIVFLAATINHKKIFESYDFFRKRKLEHLKDACASEHVKGLTKERLQEDIETEYYRLATGIFAEKCLREAMISAHKDISGDIGYIHFLRGKEFIGLERGKLIITINKFDKAIYIFNLCAGLLMAFFGFILLLSPSLTGEKELGKVITDLILGFIFLGGFLFFAFQFRPYYSANLIKKELAKTRNPDIPA